VGKGARKMTGKERKEFLELNKEITKEYEKYQENYSELRDFYFHEMGYAECSYDRFIEQIASCKSVSENQRLSDIMIVRQFHQAEAKFEVLTKMLYIFE